MNVVKLRDICPLSKFSNSRIRHYFQLRAHRERRDEVYRYTIGPRLGALKYIARFTILNSCRISHYLKFRAIMEKKVMDNEELVRNQSKILNLLTFS